MASLSQFARRITAVSIAVRVNASEAVKRTALDLDRRLILRTPVDTGRARSNWLVGINNPRRDTVDAVTAGAAEALARSTVAAAQPGDEIWTSNNLPYVPGLNRGRSRQAPAGFVEDAVDQTVEGLRSVRLVD